ncbi:MAG: adenylyltransferase/cytidyltransferase family protein [Anaerotignum sp.]
MRKAIYAGSFDPVTLGHLDIIERASKLFDCLVVAVLENPNKHSLFTVEERKVHLEMVTKHLENVEVASFRRTSGRLCIRDRRHSRCPRPAQCH